MSREFGEYMGGYFHDKIRNALYDLENESFHGLHKEFIPLFKSLYEVAYAISSVEAGDSNIERTISTTLLELPRMKKCLADVEESLKPYKQVAEDAVRKHIAEEVKKKKEK